MRVLVNDVSLAEFVNLFLADFLFYILTKYTQIHRANKQTNEKNMRTHAPEHWYRDIAKWSNDSAGGVGDGGE